MFGEINTFEIALCLNLGYYLNPITYVDLADELVCGWNVFAREEKEGREGKKKGKKKT